MKIEDIYRELPIIETDRLILRKITMKDVPDIFKYASDQEVAKYVTWPAHQSVIETRSFVEYVLYQYKKQKLAPWGIEYKSTGRLIGTIDFVWWDTEKKEAEVGYALSREYWGKGIATEGVKKLIQYGFNCMQLKRIQARCLVENTASKRVMEKSGMVLEGMKEKEIFVKGEYKDIYIYSIKRE